LLVGVWQLFGLEMPAQNHFLLLLLLLLLLWWLWLVAVLA
jgi:hypothetical protein